MRKRISFSHFSRTSSHYHAMMKNMCMSLIEHERIITTEPKAKAMRKIAENVIGYAKKWAICQQAANDQLKAGFPKAAEKAAANAHHQLKMANSIVHQRPLLIKLLHHLGPRYLERNGGYTRVLKLQRPRAGDSAPRAVIEYVDRPGELRPSRAASGTLGVKDLLLKYEVEYKKIGAKESAAKKTGAAAGEDADDDEEQHKQQQLVK